MSTDFVRQPEMAPFWHRGGPVGCLLIHGYTDSPGTMRHLGDRLAGAGFTVRCDLLPGHGADPLDLNLLTWRDWWTAVAGAHDALARECPRVVAVGLSFGGTLALHLATHRPLAGVVTLAGMIELTDPKAHWSHWLKYLWTMVAKSSGPDVRRWTHDGPYPGYMHVPVGGLSQTLDLADHVSADLTQVRCPVLAVHGRHDGTVPLTSSQRIVDASPCPESHLLVLEGSAHVITMDQDREQLADAVVAFATRVGADKATA